MGTRHMINEITMADLEQAFEIAEESLLVDLSVIRISMIRDVHDDSIELAVLVYGQDSSEEDPPIAEFWIDPDVIGCEEEFNNGGVEPGRLRAVFSVEVLILIFRLNIPIQWLGEDGDLITVSLGPGEDNGFRLLPVDQ